MRPISRISYLIVTVALLFAMPIANCQETQAGAKEQSHQQEQFKHLIGAGFGFTFIPVASIQGTTEASGLFVPNVGLDYFYGISLRWVIGFMGALEIGQYSITDDEIEIKNALNFALLGMYRATSHLGLFAGGGIEIDQNENLGVFRLGSIYTIDAGKNWAIVPKLYVDFKKSYNTWSLAVTFSRKL